MSAGAERRRTGTFRDRVVELRRVRAGDLAPNPANWRRHPEHRRRALRALLREVGYADALIARQAEDGRLVLIDGHLRQSMHPDQVVPVLVVDVTAEEAETLLATLDPLASLAEPDTEALAHLIEQVRTESAAVADLLARVARDAGLPVRKPLAEPEDIPDPPRRPRTRRGQVWLLGEHRLTCGDATSSSDLEGLMAGERAALLWTDPPYGVGYVGKTRDALTMAGDDPAGLEDLLGRALSTVDGVLAAGASIYVAHPAGPLSGMFVQAFLGRGWRLLQTLVWVKDAMVLGHGDYHYRHEPMLYGHKPGGGRRGRGHAGWYGRNDQDSVFEIPRPRASTEHPTAKPVELLRRCVLNSSAPASAVLDPFAGSGSTVIACELTGRRAFALELDPAYCDVILRRWEAVTGRRAVREEKRR